MTFNIVFVPSAEPHEAHTLLTPEAFFCSDNNTHAWLILELTDNIQSALDPELRVSGLLLQKENNFSADRRRK